jgi:hypothetical protein
VIAAYLAEDRRQDAALRSLLWSLEAQTYPHWRAVVVHDGPLPARLAGLPENLSRKFPRVTMAVTPKRLGQSGHPHRHAWACKTEGEFVGFTNQDNYYAPVYLEWTVSKLVVEKADLAYCDMVHSHQLWRPFTTAPKPGRIDLGCYLARRGLVAATPWTDHSFRGDGTYFEQLAKRARKVVKVPATLFVHN